MPGGKDHSEEREEGEDENDESANARESTGRGRFRGRYRGGGYRPRYFNRPRRNTDGEENSGEKNQGEELEQVRLFCFITDSVILTRIFMYVNEGRRRISSAWFARVSSRRC